jgi:phosphate transport system substrate-binding protein
LPIDGSSSAYNLAELAAERFAATHPQVEDAVGNAGTGNAFSKLCRGEIDIALASREPDVSERCDGLERFCVARDTIVVVVNNTFVDSLTLAELRRIWEGASSWQQLRPSWPAERIRVYGPSPGSGTYEHLARVIGLHAPRSDYATSEDYQLLVRGMRDDRHALGVIGRGVAHLTRLREVPIIDAGDAFDRSIDAYTLTATLERPQTRGFIDVLRGADLPTRVGLRVRE